MSEEVKKANAKQEQQEVPTQSNTSTTVESNLPKEETLIGEILSIEEISDLNIVLITIMDEDEKSHTVSTQKNYAKKLKLEKRFAIESIATLTVAKRVKDKTTYEKNGEIFTHTSDGLQLERISEFSRGAWERRLAKETASESAQEASLIAAQFADKLDPTVLAAIAAARASR